MQVGKVVYILTNSQSETLLSILEQSKNDDLKSLLESAKKTIFIDDVRNQLIET